MYAELFHKRLAFASLLRFRKDLECSLEGDVVWIILTLKRSIVACMYDVWSESTGVRLDHLSGIRMFSKVARQQEVLHSILDSDTFGILAVGECGTSWLRCLLVSFLRSLAHLHIGSEASGEHVDRLFGLRVCSDRFAFLEFGSVYEACAVAVWEGAAGKELTVPSKLDDHALATLRAWEFLWRIAEIGELLDVLLCLHRFGEWLVEFA